MHLNFVYTHFKDNTPTWPNGITYGDWDGLKLVFGNAVSWQSVADEYVGRSILFKYGLDDVKSGKLAASEKYIFIFEYFISNIFNSDYILDIPPEVVQDIKNDRARFVVISTAEGSGFNLDKRLEFIKLQSRAHNIPLNKIIYIDCNCVAKNTLDAIGIKNVYYNKWQYGLYHNHDINVISQNILNKKLRNKKYLCLNKGAKHHRAYLVDSLLRLGLAEDALITFPNKHINFSINNFDGEWAQYQTLKAYVPMILDIKDPAIQPDTATPDAPFVNPAALNIDIQTSAYINIVTETHYSKDYTRMHLSEKTFKPILSLQPFIIVGQQHSLKCLKEMGYKSFNDFFDESYDNIENDKERFNAIIEQIKIINSKTHEQLANMLYDMHSILMYNYNHHIKLSESEGNCKAIVNGVYKVW